MRHREPRVDLGGAPDMRNRRCRATREVHAVEPVLNAFRASIEDVVASGSGVSYFSTVASDSPTRVLNCLATCVSAREDIFLARRLHLLLIEDVAGATVPCA